MRKGKCEAMVFKLTRFIEEEVQQYEDLWFVLLLCFTDNLQILWHRQRGHTFLLHAVGSDE